VRGFGLPSRKPTPGGTPKRWPKRRLAGCSLLATEFLSDLVRRLEGRDLPYAPVGSIAAMSNGEPRATLDVDVVVVLNGSDLEAIGRLFPPPAFYLSLDAAREAVRRNRSSTSSIPNRA
jgi:hypothetical protein